MKIIIRASQEARTIVCPAGCMSGEGSGAAAFAPTLRDFGAQGAGT